MFDNFFFMAFGFIFLIKGADILIKGSSNIAKKFNISDMIIGLTIISIGTSLPELFISITSAIKGNSDISIGNVIGSNICNMLLVLGVSSLIKPLDVNRRSKFIDIPMTLIYIILFALIVDINPNLSKISGITLIIFFLFFLFCTIFTQKRENSFKEENVNKEYIRILPNVFYIILGIVILKIGGDWVVDNGVEIAQKMNISDKVIGLTIIAIGTSLPELITSITAVVKVKSDMAIGNVLVSIIFNFFLIIGAASIIKPITYSSSYDYELLLLIVSNLILFLFSVKKDKMTKQNGLIYVLMYMVYVINLV